MLPGSRLGRRLVAKRASQGSRHRGAQRKSLSPGTDAFGWAGPDNIVQSGANRKLIIYTLRQSRFGARRKTVLAAMDPGLVFNEARNELIDAEKLEGITSNCFTGCGESRL